MSECEAGAQRTLVLGVDEAGQLITGCRCLICARCGHHTGNAHQGHYWAFCIVTGKVGAFHFCCPNDCELSTQEGAIDGHR